VSVEPILSGIALRCPNLRTGVDIGFPDVSVSERLRERFRALWMTVASGDAAMMTASAKLAPGSVHRIGGDGSIPFDGNQFEVAVLNGGIITQALVRDIHRVLKPAGFLFFSVEETVRHGPGNTLSKLYNAFLKCGYDVVSISRPPWWRFGRDGKVLTVCARKKNWREQRQMKVFG